MQEKRRKKGEKGLKLDIINKSKDGLKTTFRLREVNASFANALRRTMISKVPTMAVEEVSFTQNSSALYDEVVALRLGLIPLTSDPSFLSEEECKCKGKGCAKCTVTLNLDKTGPCTVYAKDLVSSDPRVVPAFPDMPIVILLEGQEIRIEAYAVKGVGTKHTKWSPCWVSYQYFPNVRVLKDCNACGDCVKVCPKNILEKKDDKIAVRDSINCHLCNACVDACTKNAIKAEGSENDFLFTVESFGQLPISVIIEEACRYLSDELTELSKNI